MSQNSPSIIKNLSTEPHAHMTPFGKETDYIFLNVFKKNENSKPSNTNPSNTSLFKPLPQPTQTKPLTNAFFQIKPT